MKDIAIIAAIGIFLWVFIPKACNYDAVREASGPTVERRASETPSFMDVVRASYSSPDEVPSIFREEDDTREARRPAAPFVDNGDPVELIRRVSLEYDVPAGALYGIWRKESNGLRSGWGESANWHRAADLARDGSICRERYGERCLEHWEALQRICDQRRRDGSRVCDPQQVRTSYALAMGPMQHMPAELIRVASDGSASWGRRVVDYDGDGVVDPHDLDDAMAMSANMLRYHYEQKVGELGESEAWRWAVNRYFGSQTAGYFEGGNGRHGVADHWRSWCETYGSCTRTRMAYALADR